MVALLIGIILVVLGSLGLWNWRSEFVEVVQGAFPVLFILIGLAAIAAGIASWKDKAAAKKREKAAEDKDKTEAKPVEEKKEEKKES